MQKVKWDCGILILHGYILFCYLPHKCPTKIQACPQLSAVSWGCLMLQKTLSVSSVHSRSLMWLHVS